MSRPIVGIDLAKNVYALHGVGTDGKVQIRLPRLGRNELVEAIAKIQPSLIAMESCSGAHHWARELSRIGHTVKLISPRHVTAYRIGGKHQKNDANDAAAICEAATRPHMRFVPTKTEQQQALQTVLRTRDGFVDQRTVYVNRIRGLLAEFGLHIAPRADSVRNLQPTTLHPLPRLARSAIEDLMHELKRLDVKIAGYDAKLRTLATGTELSRLIMQLPGVGATTACTVLATVSPDQHNFTCGRQFAAWLGLTPRQRSSGGKIRHGKISCAGDTHLRTLLTMCARSLHQHAKGREDPISQWANQICERRGYWRGIIAIASKLARMIWAIIKLRGDFKLPMAAR